MAKRFHVTLTSEERCGLEALVTRRKGQSAVVKRAYMLLALDESGGAERRVPDEQICRRYMVGQRSIERVRQRFVEEGFDVAVYGKKRTIFKEKKFDGRVEAELIALRCQAPPEGHQAWTLRLLAEQMVVLGHVGGISHESVRQLLKKTN